MRDVEPWGVVTHRGRWYLVGHDRDRGAVRSFRLSRIADDVTPYGPRNAVRKPEGVDLREIVARVTWHSPVTGSAVIWVADGRGRDVRRLATVRESKALAGRSGVVLEVPVRSWDWIARLVTGLGADALVLEPRELRADVMARLRAVSELAVSKAAAAESPEARA